MNYSEMSDFEINKAVALKRGIECSELSERDSYGKCGRASCYVFDWPKVVEFDPCNSPSNAWPIILEHGISIVYVGMRPHRNWEAKKKVALDNWRENIEYENCEAVHENPLRAAMIVFLKMGEL